MAATTFRYDVEQKLEGKPFLSPVFSDLHDIGRRLREVDETLFIIRNHRRKRYEVHSIDSRGTSLQWVVPYPHLDCRVIRLAKKNNLLTRGDIIFKELDQANAKVVGDQDRQFANDVGAICRETRTAFAKMAWNDL